MIFFLIAGTATPAFLVAMRGGFGLACLIVMWSLTLTAAAIHMARMVLPERLVGAMFLGLGWMGGLALPAVWIRAGAVPGALMLAGGLLYTAGAISSPSPLARPVSVGVRLPRGLSRLTSARRNVPVCRDSTVHQLSREPLHQPADSGCSRATGSRQRVFRNGLC